MNKLWIKILLWAGMAVAFTGKVMGQSDEAQQLLLDLEKLTQLKQILKDMKTGYEMVSKGYNTIKNLSEGNFNLHQTFLSSLLQVSPLVSNYKKITDIITGQLQLVKEYKAALNTFRESGRFNPAELEYIGKVYRNLFRESAKNLEALTTVLTAGALRMTDEERLTAIDHSYTTLQNERSFLRHFNNQTLLLALQRAKEQAEVQTMQGVYGITK